MIRKHSESGTVEFLLDRDGAETPYLVGSWDGWEPPGIPLVRQPGEERTWKTEVALPPGEHQFRYRIGNEWFNDPSADRSVENGMGGENSVVIVEESPKKRGRRTSPGTLRRTSNDVW
jgi:Glycogen recognition site of AMP-activated protein kinase